MRPFTSTKGKVLNNNFEEEINTYYVNRFYVALVLMIAFFTFHKHYQYCHVSFDFVKYLIVIFLVNDIAHVM